MILPAKVSGSRGRFHFNEFLIRDRLACSNSSNRLVCLADSGNLSGDGICVAAHVRGSNVVKESV